MTFKTVSPSMFTHRSSILLLATLLAACNGSSDIIVTARSDNAAEPETTDTHQNGAVSYSTVAAGVWPPQPVGVSNVKAFDSENVAGPIRDTKLGNVEATALQNPQVLTLLGNRFEVVGRHRRNHKQSAGSTTEIEIFSYSNNLLVTVSMNEYQQVATGVQQARDYQPAHSVKEGYRAIALAAGHLENLGYKVSNLVGTSLLAHPTAAEYKSDGHLFYPQRIIYVTFGHGEGNTPLFRATVNLSSETVSKAGPL